jgi:septin family protein
MNFVCRKELNTQIARWGLADSGFGYDVVAVFGSQSTGKSTLLNRLFGTTFDVMDETQRRQTTKGELPEAMFCTRVDNRCKEFGCAVGRI